MPLIRGNFILILIVFQIGITTTMAQSQTHRHNQKDGQQLVGPLDYHLPAPPSLEELMQKELEERMANMELELPKLLFKSYLLPFLKQTGKSDFKTLNQIGKLQSLEGWLLMEIERATTFANWEYVADLQNLLACEYFRMGNTEDAFSFFEQALTLKIELKDQDDVDLIKFNLASAHEFSEDYTCALDLFESIYQEAKRRGNRLQQGYAMLRMAHVKAKGGSYLEAENDLIHKILPLFKSVRSTAGEQGRVEAYYTLANVYSLQDRYPETQWFLLQAKEIAQDQGFRSWLTEIIFNLAETKKSSGNYDIALLEYEEAKTLAEEGELLVMQLAIQDALGYIYHESGQYKEALEALNRYDSLKNRVISMEFPQ